jgi:hypothetical protein
MNVTTTINMTSETRRALIEQIRQLPGQLEGLVSGLSAEQLTTVTIDGVDQLGYLLNQVDAIEAFEARTHHG